MNERVTSDDERSWRRKRNEEWEKTQISEEWSDERREERNDEESPLNFFSPDTIPSQSCGHDPDEGVANVTSDFPSLFLPSHLSLSFSFQHSNSFLCPSHSSNISIITTIFVEQSLLLFNTLQHMPNHLLLTICPMRYIQKILCNSSTTLPHALNQNNKCPMHSSTSLTPCINNKRQCPMLPTTSPHATNSKTTYASMPMPHSLILAITHRKGCNPASPLVDIFLIDVCFQDIPQETWSWLRGRNP